MHPHRFVSSVLAATFAWALASPGGAACIVRSGPQTAALVELYTSEGCSSCPPAEKILAQLGRGADRGAWYALALHVNYWDYIGWQDPYAQAIFADRQRWLVQTNQHRVVYTPHFFVAGTEVAGEEEALRTYMAQVNQRPAAADIELGVTDAGGGALRLQAAAHAANGADPLALYLALTEKHLVSRVARGENGGATLTHEHVVRTWLGPFALLDGTTRVQHELTVADKQRFERGELVAFVENERTGLVLQAVGLPACTP